MYNWGVHNKTFSLSLFLITVIAFTLSGTACSAEVTLPDTPTPTQVLIITATLPPTQTLPPSPTLESATTTPVIAPAEGQTISQLNVRSAPSADSNQIGTVSIATNVQIVGKDPTSGWWMILYPDSPTGRGWVAAQFVQVADPSIVPVINPQEQTTVNAPVTGLAPEPRASSTIEVGSAAVLPSTPAPILATAFPDGDSAQSPAVSMTLTRTAMRSFNYNSDISSPEGDPEDWVQFSLDGQTGQQLMVSVVLGCTGSGKLNVELIQNSAVLQGWDNLPCDQQNSQLQLYLYAGAPYYLRLFPAEDNTSLSYLAYTLTVQLYK